MTALTAMSVESAEPLTVDGAGIEVQRATTGEAPSEEDIVGWIETVLDTVPARDDGPQPAGRGEVCVRLVDEAESATLNGQYRGKQGPTNVLSFPAEVEVPEALFWGDIVVCVPLVHREAAEQGKTVSAHFTHLIVHGVLHLLGYDHQSAAEADQMESIERRILDRFGVADPYGEG